MKLKLTGLLIMGFLFVGCSRVEEFVNENINLRKIGETCGPKIGKCEENLKCAYPCGIPGCEFQCLPKDEPPRP